MIYRIQVDMPPLADVFDLMQATGRHHRQRYIGAGCFPDLMAELGLRKPIIANRRARFYFTEQGWKKVGRIIAARAREWGHLVKVFRLRSPDRSQIVYEDELQLAILARKKDARQGTRRSPGHGD